MHLRGFEFPGRELLREEYIQLLICAVLEIWSGYVHLENLVRRNMRTLTSGSRK